MQLASNGVALNLWKNFNAGALAFQVPSIDKIASFDASSIGENLFRGELPSEDTAIVANAAWSGALGFNLLGGSPPYESWRLLTGGDAPGTSGATLNTLDDVKNVLFAVISYSKAFEAGLAAGSFDFAKFVSARLLGIQLGDGPLHAQVEIALSSGVWLGVVSSVAARTPEVGRVVSLIEKIGTNRFLDMLIGASLGKVTLGNTTDANFIDTAHTFFNQLTPAQIQGVSARLLPDSSQEIYELAKTDVNVRAALGALSSVALKVSDDVAEQYRMYDQSMDEGVISDQWLQDRSKIQAAFMLYFKGGESDGVLNLALKLPFWQLGDTNIVVEGNAGGNRQSLVIDGVDLFVVDPIWRYFGNDLANQQAGAGQDDHLFGGAGNDTLQGNDGHDYLEGNADNDSLDGGAGRDALFGGAGADILDGGKDSDVLYGGADNDQLLGGLGNDVLYGGRDDDDLSGDDGHDFLNGGAGRDTLKGGTGNDYLYDQGGQDVNYLRGGDGNDVLEVQSGNGQTELQGGTGNDILKGAQGINSLEGGDGNDVIYGNEGYDIIKGDAGADNIEAGGGSDVITGGAGADYLRGQLGNDTYRYDTSDFGTDLIQDNQGSDVLYLIDQRLTSATYDPAKMAWVGSGYEIRRVNLGDSISLAINATGDEHNTIYIHDWQEGQFGISLSGQEQDPQRPNITPVTANARPENNKVDVIRSDGGDGGLGNDILIGTGSHSLLTGGSGNDILDGRDGNDWLEGGEGNDLILTGSGRDVAFGGDGDDIIRVGYTLDWYSAPLDSGDYAFFYGAGSGFQPKAGTDTESQFVFYVNGVERRIEHPQMAVFDFKFTPEISRTDTYEGKFWWWNVGDPGVSMEPSLAITVTLGNSENVGPGVNLTESPSTNLGKPIDYKVFLGNAKDILRASTGEKGARIWGGDGNDILYGGNDSDVIQGDADNDVLIGYDGADELYGGAGSDELSGGAGRDFLDGGSENDTLIGGLGADVLYGGSGNDKLSGDAMYLVGTNWYPNGLDETKMGGDLLYGGSGNDTLWGNNGDDYLFGGDDHDVLSGGADNDHLFGDEGDDTLIGGGGDDFLDGGSGNDLLFDDVTGRDERGQLNKSNDILFGRAGDDELDGGAGDDILDGGDDNDVLTGGDGNDILRGGAGKDSLYGDSGATAPGMDILEGGTGDDMLSGGGGSDMYVFNLGDGKDTIQDDGSNGSHNIIVFKFSSNQIKSVVRNGQDLVISYGTDDRVTVEGYYGGGFSHAYDTALVLDGGDEKSAQPSIAQICFEDGTVWSRADIHEMAPQPEDPFVDPFSAANLPYFVSALLSREVVRAAGKNVLTYSFAETFSGGEMNAYIFTDEQKAAVRSAMSKFSAVIDVSFTEAAGQPSDLRFFLDDLTSADAGAYAGYASSQTGEIHLNSSLFARLYPDEFGQLLTKQTFNEGEPGFEVLLHEIGHALGLKHPFELPLLPDAENNNANTLMSYTRTVAPARQLAPFDIAALQFLYGVSKQTNIADDVYNFGDKYVYDAAGIDTFDASAETQDVVIDLSPGGWSFVGQRAETILSPQQTYIGHGTQVETAIGGIGNDRLLGNTLQNVLIGGNGDDTLIGGAGDDLLRGGAGVDTYRFTVGDGTDYILDSDGLSRIELAGVTATEVYWHGGYLYHGTGGDRIAVRLNQIGELVIQGVSYVGQAVADAVRIVLGTEGNDSLTGSDSVDRMKGLDGNDTLSALGGNDHLEGGLGNDLLQGGAGDDVLDGGAGNDELHGDADSDLLLGSTGDDSMYGGAGTDTLDGGAGKDVLSGGGGDDVLYGGEDNDVLHGDADHDAVFGGAGDDTLHGGSGADTLDGGAGSDALYGGIGTDVLDGGTDNDVLHGEADNDSLFGNSGDDTLYGGAGDDVLDGGAGNDLLYGAGDGGNGGGNDTFRFGRGSGQDSIYESVSDFDEDRIQMVGLLERDLAFSFVGSDLLISVVGAEDRLTVKRYFESGARTIEVIELADGLKLGKSDVFSRTMTSYVGGNGNDYVSGQSANNRLVGLDGNDTLSGSNGYNLLIGGRGNDRLIGGLGMDTYVFNSGDGRDVIQDQGGFDQVVFGTGIARGDISFLIPRRDLTNQDPEYSFNRPDDLTVRLRNSSDSLTIQGFLSWGPVELFALQNGEQITFGDVIQLLKNTQGTEEHEYVIGGDDTNDSLAGLSGNDSMYGFGGNDWIDGGEGNDSLKGGEGDDYLLGGGGADELFGGNGGDTLIGGEDKDYLEGNAGNDWIEGGVGNDKLYGASGNDSLFGDDGKDTVEGGMGDDLLNGGDGHDWIFGGDGRDTLYGGAGNDRLWGANGHTQESDGANTLIGGPGNDEYSGGNGDDVFVFGRGDGSDTIEGLIAGGIDTLQFGPGVLPEHVQLYRDGSDLVAVIDGSSTQTRIKSYYTNASLPVEWMAFENGVVWGIEGIHSRTITGGVNQLVGAAGNDIFIVDNTLDTVSEAAGGGVDEIRSSVSYVLPANVENFTATGVLNLVIRGNGGNNVLRGNVNNNEFWGGGGTDRAIGGLGDDTYYLEMKGVLEIEEKAGEGTDTLLQVDDRWATYEEAGRFYYGVYLPDHVENLILATTRTWWVNGSNETEARGGFGNSLDNLIQGDQETANLLDGYGGRDTLIGGSSADVFRVDREDDVIIDHHVYDFGKNASASTFFTSGVLFAGGDLVQSSAVRYTLGDNIEHLHLIDWNALDGVGNYLNNTIVGNENANRIEGAGGNDRLFDNATRSGGFGGVARPSEYAYDNDTLIGGDGDDQITAYNGDDYLYGGAGDDLLTAKGGLATFIGGTGNDALLGGGRGAVYRYGLGDGNDTIRVDDAYMDWRGSDGRDRLVFERGITPDQVRMSRAGEDGANLLLTLAGGGSVVVEDYFYVSYPSGTRSRSVERIDFSGGATWSRASVDFHFGLPTDPEGTSDNDLLIGDALSNVLRGLSGNDTLLGGDGNDYLVGGDGDDVLDGGFGWDRLEGGLGDDLYRAADDSMEIIEAEGGGTDTLEVNTYGYLPDHVEIGIVTSTEGALIGGSAQANTLIGNIGADSLFGNEGNDILIGGAGADVLDGGLGDDVFVFHRGDGQDVVQAFDVQSAIDTLRIEVLDTEVTAARAGNDLLLKIRNSSDQINVTNYYSAATYSGGYSWDHKIDRIEFGNGAVWNQSMIQSVVDRARTNRAPSVTGSIPALAARQDSLFSYAVPIATVTDPDPWDTITYSVRMSDGSSVPAWLNFDPVSRVLSGIPKEVDLGKIQFVLWGTDIYGYAAGLYVNLTVNAPNRAPTLTQELPDANAYEGAAFSYIFASTSFADPDAGDSLSFGATLSDGAALPLWLSFNPATRAFAGTPPSGTTGTISVRVTARDTSGLSASDVFDIKISLANLTIAGTAAAEILHGGNGNDTLIGAGGNDTLYGQAGNDRLDGGVGTDRLVGGAGDDVYVVDAVGDVIVENVSEGTDLVQSSVTYTLAANVENLTLTGASNINGTGNSSSNVLVGNGAVNSLTGGAGNDTLDGGAGADSLIGGTGDDLYLVDNASDVTVENANEGIDTVQTALSRTLAANVENLILIGAAAVNGTGNASANTIWGNAAANTLNGGAGVDTLIGGAGNDSYVVDNIADQIVEYVGEGADSVSASVSYTISAHVENLTLTGTVSINGTGNDLDNSLVGNGASNTLSGGAGNDTLNGGAGADSLVGGAGDDIYIVDNASDKVVEYAGEGADTVRSSISHVLAINVENLTLTGTSAINGTGNASDNVLVGNSAVNTLSGGAGNDTLDGGAGADSMVGGAGDDVYIVDNTSDKVVESVNEGIDTVRSSVTFTLATNVENLILVGASAINGTGNGVSNSLTGNAANNTLTGGGGNDTYRGGGGADTLTASSATSNDTYIWGRGEGADTLTDAGGSDLLSILPEAAADQIWLRRVSNNLEVSIIGSADRFTITNWYTSSANQVETFRLADNRTLSAAKVQGLVDAMAAFAPPAQGQTTLPSNYQSSLGAVIASSWV